MNNMAAPRKLTPAKEANVAKAYASGDSLATIQEKHGVSAGTIRAIARRNDLALRPVGRPKSAV